MYHRDVQIELNDYVDLSDAAKDHDIELWRLKRACNGGTLAYIEFGRRMLVKRTDLDTYLSTKRPGRPRKQEDSDSPPDSIS